MRVELTSELRIAYPKAVFGSLVIRNVANRKKHEALEKRKNELEKIIRDTFVEPIIDDTIQSYDSYFKKWGKTYPIKYQIRTIRKGVSFPQVSVLVDSMFLAELKSKYLTSGHDLKALKGDLTFDITKEGERYLKLNRKEQTLKMNDIILKDEKGILASILYGPALRTSITSHTENALYFAWSPYGLKEHQIISHLKDIQDNIHAVFGSTYSEIKIHD
jgi:DNA/RNA-binding domain of Phe-tRNA-synthetase-like protein